MAQERPWTELVDRALHRFEGMSNGEAGARTGINREVIAMWTRKRRQGKRIHEVRGANAQALLRFLESGFCTGSIPVRVRAPMRLPPGSHRARTGPGAEPPAGRMGERQRLDALHDRARRPHPKELPY